MQQDSNTKHPVLENKRAELHWRTKKEINQYEQE